MSKTSTIDCIINLIAGDTPDSTTTLTPDEWDDIAVTAIVLGLAPLLHWRLEQQETSIPPMALAKLAITRQAHSKRNQGIAHQLAEVLAACRQQNIPVIVLKGSLLAPLAYPEPALRPMNDIDLLFQPDNLPQVAELVENLGYQGKHKAAETGPGITKHLSTYRRAGNNAATPNPYLSAVGDRMVEPHGSLEESWFGLKVDVTPGVWQRAVPLALHGQPACRLSANDMLLHLAVHAAFHVIMGAVVFVQLYDIGRVICTWADEIEWPQLVNQTRKTGAEPFVYAALYWANTLYRAQIPPEILNTLQVDSPPDLVDYIHSLTATQLFKRTQQPPLNSLSQRVQRGFADRYFHGLDRIDAVLATHQAIGASQRDATDEAASKVLLHFAGEVDLHIFVFGDDLHGVVNGR